MNKEFETKYNKTKCRRNIYLFFKRIIDIVVAFVMLIVLFPILIIISVAIKIDSKGPVLFKQKRTGKNGKPFTLYKFRTMVCDNNVYDLGCEDKHTRVGKFLRKTSLDELPQLINILKLEVSIIGPRPWIIDYYNNMNELQRHRCDVLPGITGLAQVNGRNTISIFDKINYDLEYVINCSLFLDVKIIFLTIKAVLSKKGADAGKGAINNELEDLKKQNKKSRNNK